jgi:hypothetical protein
VDRLTVKTTYSGAKLAELYMLRIVCLHGVLKKIMSDSGFQFTSKFWEKLHESLDTKLVSRWLRMKLYMDGSAEPHCSGVKPEKAKSSDRKY